MTWGYRARRSDPTITRIPIPAPNIVGQEVPESGRAGCWVGAVVGAGVAAAVAQTQSVSVVHDGFLQKPWEQMRFD